MTRSYAVLEAPSTLGLEGDGVELLPDRLLELGLAREIGARRAGRLPSRMAKARRWISRSSPASALL